MSFSQQLGQRAVLTTYQKHALRLLELSQHELLEEIAAALDTNPVLQLERNSVEESGQEPESFNDEFEQLDEYGDPEPRCQEPADMAGTLAEDPSHDVAKLEAASEVEWADLQGGADGGRRLVPASPEFIASEEIPQAASLRQHLRWQLDTSGLGETDLAIAHLLVDALDKKGFLLNGLDEVMESAAELGASFTTVHRVLKQVQACEPLGVAAQSAREFLSLQIEAQSWERTISDLALRIVRYHLQELATGAVENIARSLFASLADVTQALDLIRGLKRCPATDFDSEPIEYIQPDVTVFRCSGDWFVRLAEDGSPSVKIDPEYEQLAERLSPGSPECQYLRSRLRDGQSFLDQLEFRNRTLLAIVAAVVSRQRPYLEQGEAAMKPLTLADIAQETGVHESTVSRVTRSKHLGTPRGTVPVRHFFSTRLPKFDGAEISATAIRTLIKRYTEEENAASPLSDSEIANLLRKQNIDIARRTVAKYRKAMSVPSVRVRKKLSLV